MDAKTNPRHAPISFLQLRLAAGPLPQPVSWRRVGTGYICDEQPALFCLPRGIPLARFTCFKIPILPRIPVVTLAVSGVQEAIVDFRFVPLASLFFWPINRSWAAGSLGT